MKYCLEKVICFFFQVMQDRVWNLSLKIHNRWNTLISVLWADSDIGDISWNIWHDYNESVTILQIDFIKFRVNIEIVVLKRVKIKITTCSLLSPRYLYCTGVKGSFDSSTKTNFLLQICLLCTYSTRVLMKSLENTICYKVIVLQMLSSWM